MATAEPEPVVTTSALTRAVPPEVTGVIASPTTPSSKSSCSTVVPSSIAAGDAPESEEVACGLCGGFATPPDSEAAGSPLPHALSNSTRLAAPTTTGPRDP